MVGRQVLFINTVLGQPKAGKKFVYILEAYNRIIQASTAKKMKLGWTAAGSHQNIYKK